MKLNILIVSEVLISCITMILSGYADKLNAIVGIDIIIGIFTVNLILAVWRSFFNANLLKFVVKTMLIVPLTFYFIIIGYYQYIYARNYKELTFLNNGRKFEIFIYKDTGKYTISEIFGDTGNQSKEIYSGVAFSLHDTTFLLYKGKKLIISNDRVIHFFP